MIQIDNRENKIEKIAPPLLEAYDLQIKVQENIIAEAQQTIAKATAVLTRTKTQRNNMNTNLNRATNDDLSSYHFLFYGSENMHATKEL